MWLLFHLRKKVKKNNWKINRKKNFIMNVKLWVLQILVLLLGCCHGKGETFCDLDIMKFIKIEEKSPQGLASLVLHLPFKASPSSYLVIVRIHKSMKKNTSSLPSRPRMPMSSSSSLKTWNFFLLSRKWPLWWHRRHCVLQLKCLWYFATNC